MRRAPVKFDASPADYALIVKIVLRAISMMDDDATGDRLSLTMDITAVHCHDCPLDLEKLLAARDFDFLHDIAGIVRHVDRRTGKLKNHFLPRCARKEPKTPLSRKRMVPVIGTARA